MDSEPPKTSKLEFTADELPPETKDKMVRAKSTRPAPVKKKAVAKPVRRTTQRKAKKKPQRDEPEREAEPAPLPAAPLWAELERRRRPEELEEW